MNIDKNTITGMNSAGIKYENRLLAIALKFKTISDANHLIYLRPTELLELLIILKSRHDKLQQASPENVEISKSKSMDATKALINNIPAIDISELEQPNEALLVTSLALKNKDENFNLILMMQDQSIINLNINDFQIEIIIASIQKSMTIIEDPDTTNQIISLVDFILMYSVDLVDHEYFNYKEIEHPDWKKSLFANYMAILYSFGTDKGERILAGVIIKTNIQPNTKELNDLIYRLSMLIPIITELKSKYTLQQSFWRIIPSKSDEVLTMQQSLDYLHKFCKESQKNLVYAENK